MVEWVSLRHIFDICAREMGYEGGDRLRVPWWRQAAAHNQMKVTVESILAAARVRRRQESGRCDGSEEGRREGAWTAKGRGEAGSIDILGRRQVTHRWADDPVWIQVRR